MPHTKPKTIARDLSWLSFNARVLQEAADNTVPLRERIRFLGIFSNNLDEFFRVRVATLKRMMQVSGKANMHLETDPQQILDDIQLNVLNQQSEFARIWDDVQPLANLQSLRLADVGAVPEPASAILLLVAVAGCLVCFGGRFRWNSHGDAESTDT